MPNLTNYDDIDRQLASPSVQTYLALIWCSELDRMKRWMKVRALLAETHVLITTENPRQL